MFLTLFTLPVDAVSSTLANVGSLVSDIGVFIWLAIGLPLGFWIIKKVISLVAGRAR